jgi:hypothetical protein
MATVLADLARLKVDNSESTELYKQAHEKFTTSINLGKGDHHSLSKWSAVCLEQFLRSGCGLDSDGKATLLQRVRFLLISFNNYYVLTFL